ncbi:MAG: nitrite/sulfite reductase [Candidatus Methanomethylophilus sp.]|nr:nitrite/sulfite reductase [Methanomethylophilus sp.]MDD3233008.1 nitrite/sulfite reductase [Methanomethylophilus sp.]MDD4668737.1 nitrite/sulfite reductase [Methanomethylophilus sp.]
MNANYVRAKLPEFRQLTTDFYAGRVSVKDYKGRSGNFGTYAQRSKDAGMVRLRLAGGSADRDKLQFIADAIAKYRPNMVHATTCEAIQFHGLKGDAIIDLIDEAMDHGIFTYAGGGDCPRNVTASPLSGVIKQETFSVLPFARETERYLMDRIQTIKLPRKLKVGFSNEPCDTVDAALRDLGFLAKADGTFDVYSAGGLGANPKLGLLVKKGADPKDLLCYLETMVRMFTKYGNYENRAKARSRYMRDTLGDEGYCRAFNEILTEVLKTDLPRALPEEPVMAKKGDGSVPHCDRAFPQKQTGLYYVKYHPLGGDPQPEKFRELCTALAQIPDGELRTSPDQTMYLINLTGTEADKMARLTDDGAKTAFEASVSCVGANVCQIGLRDSHGLLMKLIDMERRNGFADGALPVVHISGCVSSCGAHQVQPIAFRGGPSVDGQPSFVLYANGSHIEGKERLGVELGTVLESDIPALLEAVGKAVTAAGTDYRSWSRHDPNALLRTAQPFFQMKKA